MSQTYNEMVIQGLQDAMDSAIRRIKQQDEIIDSLLATIEKQTIELGRLRGDENVQ